MAEKCAAVKSAVVDALGSNTTLIPDDESVFRTMSSQDVNQNQKHQMQFIRKAKLGSKVDKNDTLKPPPATYYNESVVRSTMEALRSKLKPPAKTPKWQKLPEQAHAPRPNEDLLLPHLFYNRSEKGSAEKPSSLNKNKPSAAMKKSSAEQEEKPLKQEIFKRKPLPKNFECGVCEQKFIVKAMLDAHKLKMHSGRAEKKDEKASKPSKTRFNCQYCDRVFDLQKTLQMHQVRYCPKIPYNERKNLEDPFLTRDKKPPLPRIGMVRSDVNYNDEVHDLYHLIANKQEDAADKNENPKIVASGIVAKNSWNEGISMKVNGGILDEHTKKGNIQSVTNAKRKKQMAECPRWK